MRDVTPAERASGQVLDKNSPPMQHRPSSLHATWDGRVDKVGTDRIGVGARRFIVVRLSIPKTPAPAGRAVCAKLDLPPGPMVEALRMPETLRQSLRSLLRSRLSPRMGILALGHPLAICQRIARRPRIRAADRPLRAWLSRHWWRWCDALIVVRLETVIAWLRRKLREYRTELVGPGHPSRPAIAE